jgi:hypothetical protein
MSQSELALCLVNACRLSAESFNTLVCSGLRGQFDNSRHPELLKIKRRMKATAAEWKMAFEGLASQSVLREKVCTSSPKTQMFGKLVADSGEGRHLSVLCFVLQGFFKYCELPTRL